MSRVSIEDVRRVLSGALGDSRLESVGADEPLLRSGVITSIELVTIVVDLERHFGVSIPDSLVTAEHLDSLSKIAAILSGEAHSVAGKAAPHVHAVTTRTHLGMRQLLQHPLAALVAVAAWLSIINIGAAKTIGIDAAGAYRAFLEGGSRLYPYSGLFSEDDFRFAFQHHEINTPRPPGDTVVAVFGDSGTIGSFLPSRETIPAQLQDTLRQSDPSYRVFNLAWFGRLIEKDVMLLELAWEQPMNVVVFTIGREYFSKEHVGRWIREYRHCSLNWPLFHAFVERVPPDQRVPFNEMEAELIAADEEHRGAQRRWAYQHFDSMHYAPYLQYVWTAQLPPAVFGSDMRWDMTMVRKQRYAQESAPIPLQDALRPDDVDERQIQILSTVLRMLSARGVRVVLYLEPEGPKEWRTEPTTGATRIAALGAQIARETGAPVVDSTWALDAKEFLDSSAHYTPAGNRVLAEALAEVVRETTRR